jgi:hypothetical protein
VERGKFFGIALSRCGKYVAVVANIGKVYVLQVRYSDAAARL